MDAFLRKYFWSRGPIFGLFLILFLFTGAGVLFLNPSVSQRMVNALSNTSPELNRLDLAKSGLKLIGDFPFTGGGLKSFPGLFSHYILVNPNFITSYIHNIFLDVTLEQGILGLAVTAWVLFGSIWLLVRPRQLSSNQLIRGAILTGLLILIIHGLEDNIVYYTRHVPLLFLLPGMAVAITLPEHQQAETSLLSTKFRQVAIAGGMVSVLILAIVFYRPLLSAWYADLGAVAMARIDLKSWGKGAWDDGRNVSALLPAEYLFTQSLQYDNNNRTAQHRLGLIAMLRRDFPTAVLHLEAAHQIDPNYRGIHKSLGYSYAWSGRLDEAAGLLSSIPEAGEELRIYSWWWWTLGHEDLAKNAISVATLIDTTNTLSTGPTLNR